MPSTTCAYCGRLSHLTRKWAGFVINKAYMVQGAATCDNCGMASIGFRLLTQFETPTAVEQRFDANDELNWYPRTAVAPEFPDVPDAIARAAKEAHEAHSINALMAAILMARTVVEATAKDKGIAKGSLFEKIDAMKDAELIRKSTAEAAHEIRLFGNNMAHGDIDETPEPENAAEVLELMDEVLNEVFRGPARTQRIKDKRTSMAPVNKVPSRASGIG